jgi:predicted O-methyltransferase YrrM
MLISRIINKMRKLLNNPIHSEKRILAKYGLAQYDTIFSHMTTAEKIAIYNTIKKFKKKIVAAEIGSYLGASACFICSALKSNDKLICIDTWGNDAMQYGNDIDGEKRDTYTEFTNNTSNFNGSIIKLRGWSTDVIGQVRTITDTLDFLFIDGDHNYDGVKKDWDLYSPFLKKGSVIAFHDTEWAEGVNKVIAVNVKPVADIIYKLPNLEILQIR